MDMAPPRWLGELTRVEWEPLYRAFGLTGADRPRDLTPQIVSTGLADIMMPVRDRETLLRARQNETLVAELSRRQKVTGVHMFCLGTTPAPPGAATSPLCTTFRRSAPPAPPTEP